MPALDTLLRTIEGEPERDAALATLVLGLADRIKGASNDQNIQRLAGDLRAAAPTIVAALRTKAETPA